MGTADLPGAGARSRTGGASAYWARAAALVVARPHLWRTALRQARRLARPGWWRRPPFLPVPDADYLAFRFETQYGGDGTLPVGADPHDLVDYLEWCRTMDATSAPGGHR